MDVRLRLPPVTPTRQLPQHDLDFDQSPDHDPAGPEPVPDFEFDQSVPDAFD